MEYRKEYLPVVHLDPFSKKYVELKTNLSITERHILKEMGFICHVEHSHKFISNYLATLKTPPELRQEAWNLANDRYIHNRVYKYHKYVFGFIQKLVKSFKINFNL
ncbi:unnamed protein product, partial [Vitis vinifera]|uniref:Uncharacterized protein n=1 Tax=Vitis vinifera TaxID=29760 RepID=D7TXU3_VITVI